MELSKKPCSCCKEFKSLTEFFKQGDRYESKCKTCKKAARGQKKNPAPPIPSEAAVKDKNNVSTRMDFEREVMPVFDESIFEPRENLRKLGLSDDDIGDIATFMRWLSE